MKLEASGILKEFLRCVTVPFPPDEAKLNKLWLLTLYLIQFSAPFLGKRFQKGEPCGDTLQAILDGRDGHISGMSSQVEKRLKAIASAMVKATTTSPECCSVVDSCAICGKESLLYCGRCMNIYYCSKTCQRAHWMDHKRICKPVGGADLRCIEFVGFAVKSVLEEHRQHIDLKLTEACCTLRARGWRCTSNGESA